MKVVKYISAILVVLTISLLAQEKKNNVNTKSNVIKEVNSTQAVEGDIKFKDGTNTLLRITDEGNFGSIQFQDGVPSDVSSKLYNNSGTLYFDGSSLGSGGVGAINDLSDGIYDGESLFMGDGAGVNDDAGFSDGIKNFNLGIGKNTLNLNETGKSNAAIGSGALKSNTSGNFNVGLGGSSLTNHETGDYNTAVGFGADHYNKTGTKNTIIGYFAGHGSNATTFPGSGNIFLGFKAGYNETGSDKLYIENSDSDTPLIWGDFANDLLILNGKTHINSALSIGTGSVAGISNSLAVGVNSQVHGLTSIAVGEDNLAWGYHSSAFGRGVKTMAFASTAIGRYNVGNTLANQTAWIDTDVLFEIGNGSDDANRSNAVTVLKNGNVGFGPSSPTASLHVDAVNGVVFNGLTTGGIPIEGSGSRMMWYQGKSAFRAGNAGTDKWDDVNIGSYSTALNYHTIAKGTYSFATGYLTEANGQRSTAMGSDTKATGLHSTAIGSHTEATGNYSTAIGSYVKAGAEGTIFIGDRSHTSSIHNAITDNRFAARFANGYRFFTTSDLSVGTKMDAGDNSWSVTSDSTKKENFKQVDGEDFLKKISNLKLTSWNYKTQNKSDFRHYGPMAQDFYSAFGNDGIGTIGNDTTIASADFDGVNLIAIQALESRTKKQDVRIENQVSSIKKLESGIEVLEQRNHELVKLNSEYKNQNLKFIKTNIELRKDIELIKEAITTIKNQTNDSKFASNN